MRIIEIAERDALRSRKQGLSVAVVMDGNRRWAAARGTPAHEAHRLTASALCSTLREASELSLQSISFFCLAKRNLNRPEVEVKALVDLSSWLFTEEVISLLSEMRISPRLIGEHNDERLRLPTAIRERATSNTSEDGRLNVTFAVNYSSRQLILDEITQHNSSLSELPFAGFGELDLLIRTSGELRLSDFMLWESANAEMVFTDTLWPDFTGLHLASAVAEFNTRRRRMGK